MAHQGRSGAGTTFEMKGRLTLRAADRAYALVVERGCASGGLSQRRFYARPGTAADAIVSRARREEELAQGHKLFEVEARPQGARCQGIALAPAGLGVSSAERSWVAVAWVGGVGERG